MIQTGDYVAVSLSDSGQKVATRCFIASSIDKFIVKVECADGLYSSIYVLPMKYANELGFRCIADKLPAAVTIAKASFIAMAWIDEASPIYTSSASYYESHLATFERLNYRSIKWSASCQSPTNNPAGSAGIHACVYLPSGYPQDRGVNIHMENVGRNPYITNSQLTNMFDLLLNEFRSTPPLNVIYPDYIILTIDVSGSMNATTISPAYSNLVTYIQGRCPNSILKETTFSGESWLSIWVDQIADII